MNLHTCRFLSYENSLRETAIPMYKIQNLFNKCSKHFPFGVVLWQVTIGIICQARDTWAAFGKCLVSFSAV